MEDLTKIYAFLDNIDEIGLDRANEEIPNQLRIVVALARKNPVIFNDFCFQDKHGKFWRSPSFHHEWQRTYPEPFSGKYTAIFAPRDHAKTSQIVIGRTLWELGRNPDLFIKIVCNTDPKARKRVQELQKNIESNRRVHLVFPDLQPDEKSGWEKHKFFIHRSLISREPSVEAYGILSGATGDRADVLIFDDIVDMKNAVLQPKSRQAVKDSFSSVWLNLLSPEGTALYIATPWHLDDKSHELMKDPEWQMWKRPAISKDGKPLWPARWPLEALEDRRRKIGESAFQQQFMLRALSSEDATFSEEAIRFSTRPLRFGEWRRGELIPKDWPRYIGIDPGASLGARNSPSVIMTIAVSPEDQVRYPLHVLRRKMKFPQLIEAIIDVNDEYRPTLIYGENNSFQEAVEQQLEADRKDIPVKGHYTGSKKWDLFEGLPGLCAVMEKGGWVIPKPCSCDNLPCRCHPSGCKCVSCEWERELQYHPLWEYSDIIMAQWLCETAAREAAPKEEKKFISLQDVWDEYDREKEGGAG
jgi:hypothetical protein